MTYEPKTMKSIIGKKRGCLLFGAAGNGKTIAALSISDFFPEVLPAKEPVMLKDVYVMQFDPDGLLSALSLGMDVPGMDLSSCNTRDKMNTGVGAAIKEIREGINAGVIKAVIIDSLTFFDSMVVGYVGREFPLDDKGNGDVRMYKVVLKEHMDFAIRLREFNVHLIAICHSTTQFNASSKGDAVEAFELKKRASALPGYGEIIPAITGKARNFWEGLCCNVWPVIMKKTKGQPPKVTILTDSAQGFEGKCRSIGLEQEEPANLRKLFAKADAASVIKPQGC